MKSKIKKRFCGSERRKNGKKIFATAISVAMVVSSIAVLPMMVSANGHDPVWIDENGNGSFDEDEWNGTSIQDAIDVEIEGDASNKTIIVEPGTYDAFIVEDKSNISIIAPEGGVTVGNNTVVEYEIEYDGTGYLWSIILVINSSKISIENMDVDGTGISNESVEGNPEHFWFNGITYFNSNGSITNGSVKNIMMEAICIARFEMGSTVEILGVTLENFSVGIWLQNDSAIIENCLIDGSITNSPLMGMVAGILACDNVTVTINNSIVKNCNYMAEGLPGIGIMLGVPEMMEEGFEITDERPVEAKITNSSILCNFLGILIDEDANATLHNNNICNMMAGLVVIGNRTENINATNNWWGHETGPWEPINNSDGLGDQIIGFEEFSEDGPVNITLNVDYYPWSTEPLGFLAEDETPPTIENATALPSMISLFGMTDMPFSAGPDCTTFIVDTYDENCVKAVHINLKELVLQMVPENPQIKEDMEERWQDWLSEIENWTAWYYWPCTIWGLDFCIWMIWDHFMEFLDYEEEQMLEFINFGKFSIPVIVIDCAGNENTANIDLTIVHMMIPLKKGWNLRSTPVWLEDEKLEDVIALGDGLEFDAMIRYNAEQRRWEQYANGGWYYNDNKVAPALLKPLDAIYIYATENDQFGLIFENQPREPPVRQLYRGWNLISLAVKPWDPFMNVKDALTSIYYTSDSHWGYTQVVSPFQHLGYEERFHYKKECDFGGYWKWFDQEQWVYTRDQWYGDGWQEMMMGGGYWVYMENDDELAGFSCTPIPWLWFSEFHYYDLEVWPENVPQGDEVFIGVEVCNDGRTEGDERVELYINEEYYDDQWIYLEPDECEWIEFTVDTTDWEPGWYEVRIDDLWSGFTVESPE